MTIVIDTREKIPWNFGGELVIHKCLKHGDYSILGLEEEIALERKSLDDLVGSMIGTRRDKFFSNLEKLNRIEYRGIVVEDNFEDIVKHKYRSKASTISVIGSATAVSVSYKVPIYYCSDRGNSAMFAKKWLKNVKKT